MEETKISYDIKPYNELSPWDKRSMMRLFQSKTYSFARKMGVTYGKITVRNQKTRWGSCSSLGNINYNYKLYFLPEKYQDYVIVHELAHRKFMNHSEEFWIEVGKFYPDYKKVREEMKKLH